MGDRGDPIEILQVEPLGEVGMTEDVMASAMPV